MKRILLGLLLNLILALPEWAVQKGSFATLGYTPRALAMGGAFVGIAEGSGTSYWNPAGLSYYHDRGLFVMYGKYGDFPIYSGYLAILQGNRGLGGGAITWEYTGSRPYDRYRMSENTITYSWGNYIAPVISFGFRAKLLLVSSNFESIIGNARGWGVDIGLHTKPISWFSWGLTVWDLISRLKWDTQRTEKLPLTYQTGVAFYYFKHRLILASDLKGEAKETFTDWRLGAELWLGRALALRIGYDMKLGQGYEPGILTAGAGFSIKSKGVRYALDYAFLNQSGVLGAIHRLSLNLQWR